jgi:hypothetical protein
MSTKAVPEDHRDLLGREVAKRVMLLHTPITIAFM